MGGAGAVTGADHRAFLDATLPYVDVVYAIARQASTDRSCAEDLVQETFLRAYAGFGSHRGENTRAWLAAICLNVARSQARARHRRPVELPETDAGDAVAGTTGEEVAGQAIAAVRQQTIEACLARLPEPQRCCIVLMDVAGYTAAEIAAILDCPRGTVLARVHRGRRRLARLLVAAGIIEEVEHGKP